MAQVQANATNRWVFIYKLAPIYMTMTMKNRIKERRKQQKNPRKEKSRNKLVPGVAVVFIAIIVCFSLPAVSFLPPSYWNFFFYFIRKSLSRSLSPAFFLSLHLFLRLHICRLSSSPTSIAHAFYNIAGP